jgi:predicted DCC family thiol-disulfide oxidoreductase YuxK
MSVSIEGAAGAGRFPYHASSLPLSTPVPVPRLTVWYNTRCPICDAGIDRQRNKLIAAVQAGALAFRDINETPQALAAHGVVLDDVRRRLHATDAEGRLLVGADVALALWRMTPGERWLATLFGSRLLRPLTRFAYDRFADALFAWNRRRGRW